MLADIVGHEAPLRILRRAVATGRLHHGYLFVGPPNVGKALTALQFAKVLNCERQTTFADESTVECCDECRNCQGIQVEKHPDFLLLRPLTNLNRKNADKEEQGEKDGGVEAADAFSDIEGALINVEQMTHLLGHAALKLSMGRCRVYIIQAADRMGHEAANRLLKTLEEPPAHTVFLLTTTRPAELPPTIISRCQVIDFHPVPVADCEAYLARRFRQADPTQVRTVAALCAGRIGWAHRLLQHPEALSLREEIIGWCLGLKTMEQVECLRLGEQIVATAERWWLAMASDKEVAEKALKRGRERVLRTVLPEVLDMLASWFRDLVLVGADPGAPQIINQDHRADLQHQAPLYGPAAGRKVVLHIEELKRRLRQNANVRLAAEVLALRMLTA